MAGNISSVSFASPQALIAPDLIAQQQANEQKLALAQALRQQSLDEIKVDPGSRISWTQGAAKLGQALAARGAFKQANAQTGQMARDYGAALAGKFGVPPQAASTPATGSPSPQALAAGLQPAPDTTPIQTVDPNTVTPPAQPAAPQRGPWSLSGNPQQDMSDYMLDQGEYSKALIASHAPVDMAKTMQQARDALNRGDAATASALLASVEKQNNIPLVAGRPGAPMYDHTGKIVGMSPQNIEGGNPVIEDGKFTGGYTQAPGASGVIQTTAAAKAFGGAAGDMVERYNPQTQQMEFVPKQAALQTPGMAAAPPLGAPAAANVTGTNSANAFQDISNGAADVPNRIYALKQMAALAGNQAAQFGAGSDGINRFRGVLGTVGQSMGMGSPDPAVATNANEFQKWATQYSARSGQELGLSGSDARTQLAVHATPNGEMTREALQSVIPQMVGIENAKQGYADAANAWQQAHGPQSVQQFRSEWNKVYDPSIYTHMAQGPQAYATWFKSLNPAQAAAVRQKYIALKGIGALAQ